MIHVLKSLTSVRTFYKYLRFPYFMHKAILEDNVPIKIQ